MMKHFRFWVSALALVSLIACSREDGDGFFRIKERGVFGSIDPIVEVDAADTRATVEPDNNWNYVFEVGDKINIWSETGTALFYKVEKVYDDGRARFSGGGFALTSGMTYYSSHPLIRVTADDLTCLTTTYEGQVQTANNEPRHMAGYTYTYSSAVCDDGGNTAFQYHHLSSFFRFNITVPKAMTVTELTLTAEDDDFFVLEGTADVTTGTFTPVKKSNVMTLALQNVQLSDSDLELKAFMAIAPCAAGNYVIRLKDSEGTIYTSPVVSRLAMEAGKAARFRTEVFEGENPVVAKIGDVTYETLEAAVAAVPDGTETTITMLADYAVDGNAGITIATTKNVVLDLNSKTVTLNINESKASQLFKNNGTLTITDSSTGKTGKLTNAPGEGLGVGTWPELNFATNIITNSGTLNIEEGTIVNNAQGNICYAVDNNSTSYNTVLNMVGGTISGTGTVVRQFCNSTTKQNVINVSGGTIETTGYAAIWTQLPGSNGQLKLATLNITGGVVRGGTYAWYDYSGGDSFEAVEYSISDGEIYGYLYSYAVANGVKPGFITGGLFSTDVTSLCADGLMCIASEEYPGMFEIGYAVNLVYYYWYEDGEKAGGKYGFYEPFEGPDPVLMDGEFIELLSDIQLTKDVSFTETCSWGDPISVGGTFGLTFGKYDIDLNGFEFALPTGVSVKTDKQTSIFTAAEAGYAIVETAISEDDFHYLYSVSTGVAQIGETVYVSLADAIAAVPAGTETTITMLGNETIAGNAGVTIPAGKTVVLDLNGKTITGVFDSPATAQAIKNLGSLTITDSSAGQAGTITIEVSDENAGSPMDKNWASNVIRNDGNLIVEAGNIVNVGNGSGCYAIDSYGSGNLTVNGGNVNAVRASAIRMFYVNGGSLTVNDGIIGSGSSYMGVQVMGTGTNGVSVDISGGTFSGSYALYVGGGNASWSPCQFNISGGTFENGAGFAGAVSADNINVTGGEFHEYLLSWGSAKFIKAGTFNEAAMNASFAYLADGYKFVQDGSNYIVVPTSDPRDPVYPDNWVYYYWYDNGTLGSEYCTFDKPFVKGWLCDGEFIELQTDVTLTENIACQLESGRFSLTLGNYSIDKGVYSVTLNPGVSVRTDKQTDVFSSAVEGYAVVESSITEDGFHYLYSVVAPVAKIGNTEYTTLAEAFDAAEDGQTITLVADCTGDGIKAPQGKFTNSGLTIDFNGHTYTMDGAMVGSTGTQTQAMQLLKDNKITLKNGTLTSEKAKMLIQNYSDLTLKNMTLTLNNPNYASAYTLSNNNGTVVIDGTTINANPAGGFAFDVCRYASYPSVDVTVKGGSTINGNVEVYASNSDAKDGFKLTLTSGTMTGNLVIDATAAAVMASTPDKAVITKSDSFEKDAPDGYRWVSNGNGTSTLKEVVPVAQVGGVEYETLEAAFAAAEDGQTITLVADCAGNGIKAPQGKFTTSGLTIDFNGHTYTMDGAMVGSTGTQTQAMQLLQDNKITLKNGTLTSEKAKMLIQNYSDLTLENMTLTLNNPNYSSAYTLSNNNGTVVIDGTTINANPAGGFAFDVCRYASYPSVDVTVKGGSTINGNVEVYASNSDAKDGFKLTLTSGTMTGNLVIDATAAAAMASTPAKAVITKSDSFAKNAPDGFIWVSNGDGTSTLKAVSASVNGVEYATLEAAFDAATDGSIITLTADCAGNGIKAPQGKFTNTGLTIDFNGHTYTMDGAMVGSTGTQTQAMQLLKDNKITLKNGTLTSEKAKMLIQNYSDLKLENMTLTLDNPSYTSAYTLSNNNGTVVIDDTTINANPAGGFAFDVCRYASYPSVNVTVKGASTINGNVEVSASGSDAKDGFSLTLTSGTMSGNLVIDATAAAVMASTPDKAVIKKSDSFVKDAPTGYEWVSKNDGTSVLQVL